MVDPKTLREDAHDTRDILSATGLEGKGSILHIVGTYRSKVGRSR